MSHTQLGVFVIRTKNYKRCTSYFSIQRSYIIWHMTTAFKYQFLFMIYIEDPLQYWYLNTVVMPRFDLCFYDSYKILIFLIGNIYFKGIDFNFKFTLICIFWLVIIEIDWITLWGAYFLCTLLIMFPYVGVGDCRHQIDSIFCLHSLTQFILFYGHLRYKMWQLLMNMWMRNIQFKMHAEVFLTIQ